MNLRNERTFSVALMIAAKKEADQVGVELALNISRICEQVGVSRPYAYELAAELQEALADIRHRRPGRPESNGIAQDVGQGPEQGLRLTVEVLAFRLATPGAVVGHGHRSTYSSSFKRFLLTQYDDFVPSKLGQDAFAEAARVPIDTLRKWVAVDRAELSELAAQENLRWQDFQPPKDASDVVLRLIERLQSWHGSVREFIPDTAKALSIKPAQVARALRILGVIAPRKGKRARNPKYPGSMEPLQPGSMSVIDGKDVAIHLEGSNRWEKTVVHLIVDQATNTGTGVVVAQSECAAAASEVFDQAVNAQGGKPPLGLVVDGKPCYKDAAFRSHVEDTTMIVTATPNRGQNKGQVEGAFSEWERQVGTIVLDDSSHDRLIQSAAREAMRAFIAARNHAPRIEHDGKSRIQVLRETCPSKDQQRRDRAFITKLKTRHERRYPTFKDERSRALLEDGFERWNLLGKDATKSLRNYLSYCDPEAVKRGFAIFATKMERGVIEEKYSHRYLAKLILSSQEELDLERAEEELLKLCDVDRRWWALHDEEDYRNIVNTTPDPKERLAKVAEMAAQGGLPISGAFWRRKLREEVAANTEQARATRTCLKRLYDKAFSVRLRLIAMIADVEVGLAM